MATDLLKTYSNERVDLLDFDYLADEQFQQAHRQLAGQFLVDPTKRRRWILGGFETTNPSAQQVQVARGRAFLAQREGGLIYYTVLATEGDATKIIDASVLANGTYGVYVRFEYVDGDSGSRIFWNPAGTGSEFAQTVETHRIANWSMRAEQASPGAEWERVAEFTVSGGVITVGPTDKRVFYFEGDSASSYQSGWSSEGGGVANDRNANRSLYGVFDLETFTAATRQCLEDLKGRGLRRWWDKGIGGMNVGFDDDPVEDRIAVGDASAYMELSGGVFKLSADALPNDYLSFTRSTSIWDFHIGGATEGQLGADGLRVAHGLYVGSTGTAPTDDEIRCDGDIHCGGRQLYFGVGSDDWIEHNDTDNDLAFFLDNAEEWTFSKTGMDCHANAISGATSIDGSGDLTMGTITMTGFSVDADGDTDVKTLDVTSGPSLTSSGIATAKAISGATSIDGSGDLTMGTITMTGFSVDADGDTVVKSLNVSSGGITNAGAISGATSITASGDITTSAGIRAGGSSNPGAGDGIFTNGLVVGFDAIPTADTIKCGDADFRMDFATTDKPALYFEGDTYIEYDRSNPAGIGYRFVQDGSAVAWIRNATTFGNSIICANGLFTGSLHQPGAVGNAAIINGNTMPFCVGCCDYDGTLYTDTYWNVANVSHTASSGIYYFNYTNIRFYSGRVPTFASAEWVPGAMVDSDQSSYVRVYCYSTAGSLSDSPCGVIQYNLNS